MYLLYNLALCLATPWLILFFLKRKQAYENLTALAWRLAIYPPDFPPADRSLRIWIHGASVGELKAIAPFVKVLRETYPDAWIGVSAMTASGLATAQASIDEADRHFLVPFDLFFTAKKAMRRIRPSLFVTVETEIWPNLLKYAKSQRAKVIMVNGRVSSRSINAYRRFKRFFRQVLAHYDAISTILPVDAERLIAMGASPAQITVNGNVKYDGLADGAHPGAAAEAAKLLNLSGEERVWVAGSTRDGEEELILQAYREITATAPDLLLIIAPRHIQRVNEVVMAVRKAGFTPLLRTELTPGCRLTPRQVLIINTIGELFRLYSLSAFAYMGGSLVPLGGHNPLEPVIWGKVVFFGPSMEDFLDAKRLLEECGCGIEVRDPHDLAVKAVRLLEDATARRQLGAAGQAILRAQQGSSMRNLKLVREVLATQWTMDNG
jgi:3-deoxy-D-manno-octulosonic-acid transferase